MDLKVSMILEKIVWPLAAVVLSVLRLLMILENTTLLQNGYLKYQGRLLVPVLVTKFYQANKVRMEDFLQLTVSVEASAVLVYFFPAPFRVLGRMYVGRMYVELNREPCINPQSHASGEYWMSISLFALVRCVISSRQKAKVRLAGLHIVLCILHVNQ